MQDGVMNVLILQDRLDRLIQLESSLPKKIEQAIVEYKKNSLKVLHEQDKQNPQATYARAKRYIDKHRDRINAQRRERTLHAKKDLNRSFEEPIPSKEPRRKVKTVQTVETVETEDTADTKLPRPPMCKENVLVSFS